MTDPEDLDIDYYQREADRSERALGVIVALWMFFGGAVAGYVLTRVLG